MNAKENVKTRIDEYIANNPGTTIAKAARELGLNYSGYFYKKPVKKNNAIFGARPEKIIAAPIPGTDKVVAFVADPATMRRMFNL